MNVNWNLLSNYADPAAAFQQGLQHGSQVARQHRVHNALAAYGQNPNDPTAVNALMQADPRLGIQVRQQQERQQQILAERQQEQQAQVAKVVGFAAKAAKDPASWDMVVDHLTQQYPEAAQYKGKFDPAMRAALMARAGIDDKPENQTSMQQNYEWLKAQNPGLAETYLRNQAEGAPLMFENGDGTRTIIPRSMIGGGGGQPAPPPAAGPQPGTIMNGYRYRGGNPNDKASWEPAGGPGASSGTFP